MIIAQIIEDIKIKCVLFMFFNYYTWEEIFNNSTNTLWLNNIISWEDSSFLLNHDLFLSLVFLNNLFNSLYFTTFLQSFYSILDYIIVIFNQTNSVNFLNNLFFLDLFFFLNLFFFKYSYFFITNNVDNLFFYFSLNNEFYLFLYSFYYSFMDYVFNIQPISVYDSFAFNFNLTLLNYFYFIKWFFIFIFFIFLFVNVIRFNKFSITSNFYFSRNYFFFSSLAFENRLQFDFTVNFLYFLLLVWFIIVMTYDDVYVELVEVFHFFLIFIFIFVIFYLLYKYSIHYFAFLENSVSEGFSTSFIAKQFVRDVSNSFALFLRFFLLLFRLNIYDGLDDFLDSYYIFFTDFDEDSYFDELFFYNNFFFYFSDNHEDIIFYMPMELEWTEDLFSKYFIIWGKFFMFWAFILEEVFRLSLAFYIFYLIIFEVHAVNISYNEDNFMNKKVLSN